MKKSKSEPKSKSTTAAKTKLVENPDYKQILNEVKSASSYKEALSAIVKVFGTAKRLVKTVRKFDTKTGKPVEFYTSEDESSFPDFVFFMPDSDMGIEVHKSVAKEFTALLTRLEREKGLIAVCENDEPFRAFVTIGVERISTGGGHNSVTTYSNALVFRSILQLEYVDCY